MYEMSITIEYFRTYSFYMCIIFIDKFDLSDAINSIQHALGIIFYVP